MPEPTYPRSYGAYVLLEHLGRGGMADVELARRTVDDARFVRFVVIKRIQPRHADDRAFIRMFQDEARISAELQQENIAQVYDFGQQGDEYFLAMEYVPGVHLRHVQKVLAARGQVPPFRVTFRILADVLSALRYAHSRVDTYGRPMRLVHRDVNPRNVMLSVRGEVKLIDFGVAKADTRTEHTVGKSMKGKFAYMSPEQFEGTAPLDGRADLFAVGLVLHELVEGRSPYAGMNEAQIIQQTLNASTPTLKVPAMFPDSAMLRAIHDKALAKRPDDRYTDAGAMFDDLLRAADLVGGLATREEMAEFLRKVDQPEVGRITERLKTYRNMPLSELNAAPAQTGAERNLDNAPSLRDSDEDDDDDIELTAAEAPPSNPMPPVVVTASTESRREIRLAIGVALGAAVVFVAGVLWGVNRQPEPLPTGTTTTTTVEALVKPNPKAGVAGQDAASLGTSDNTDSTGNAPPGADIQDPSATGTATENTSATGTTAGAGSSTSASGTGAHSKRPSKPPTPATTTTEQTTTAPPPDQTTAAVAKTGTLSVTSPGASGYEVLVNGAPVGRTPLRTYSLKEGQYTITIKDGAGHKTTRYVTIVADKATVVSTGQ